MSNDITIGNMIAFDAAVLSSDSPIAALMPLTELQKRQPGDATRFTDLSSVYFVADLGAGFATDPGPVNFVAIMAHNGSDAGTWRVRAAPTEPELTGSPVPYDSGAMSLQRPGLALPWYHSGLRIAPAEAYRWWRIDIADPTNPAGFFDVGRACIDSAYVSPKGADFGESLSLVDSTVLRRSQAGSLFPVRGAQWREWECSLSYLTEADIYADDAIYTLRRRVGSERDVFVTYDLANPVYWHARGFQALWVNISQSINREVDLYRNGFGFLEMLPDKGIG